MPFQVTQRTIADMVKDSKLDIPEHQRPYIWKPKQADGFFQTIMDGLPTLSLILFEEVVDGKVVRWIEDGQQRFMTVKKFHIGVDDTIKWNGRLFSEFTPEEKSRFENYPFTVTTMEDVKLERRIELFQAIQEGTPLTNGQRFNASSSSSLVRLANSIMENSDCCAVWGNPLAKPDPKKKNLENAVAIASGVALNNIETITTSYEILGREGVFKRDYQIDMARANHRLAKLVSVYARADEICPTTAAKKKQQYGVGKYTGYILYSMCLPGRDWETDKEMFAQFIARVRRDKLAMKILTFKKPATRNWNSGRWKQGLDNLENPADVERSLGLHSDEEDSDYEDEE